LLALPADLRDGAHTQSAVSFLIRRTEYGEEAGIRGGGQDSAGEDGGVAAIEWRGWWSAALLKQEEQREGRPSSPVHLLLACGRVGVAQHQHQVASRDEAGPCSCSGDLLVVEGGVLEG
jgi:hypothetical protein